MGGDARGGARRGISGLGGGGEGEREAGHTAARARSCAGEGEASGGSGPTWWIAARSAQGREGEVVGTGGYPSRGPCRPHSSPALGARGASRTVYEVSCPSGHGAEMWAGSRRAGHYLLTYLLTVCDARLRPCVCVFIGLVYLACIATMAARAGLAGLRTQTRQTAPAQSSPGHRTAAPHTLAPC